MCSLPTVTAIRKKFMEGGVVNALYDKPRPGAIPKITGEIEAQLTMLACSVPVLSTWLIRQFFWDFRKVFRWPIAPSICRHAREHIISGNRAIHKQPNTF
jgi:hypothetical protein